MIDDISYVETRDFSDFFLFKLILVKNDEH